jgi:D-sedoheptulose 7-phosphate isomerase
LDPYQYVLETSRETLAVQEAFVRESGELLVTAAKAIGNCFRQGGKMLIFGNGGSAADAQHMAAEMICRMLIDRRPLPAIALTTDTSNLTAIGNDLGYHLVFARQVQALARKGDIAFAISTSGKSENVLLAAQEARKLGCLVIGLTGGSGGKMRDLCDIYLSASQGVNSCRIQETHSYAIHTVIDLMDRFFLES